MVEMLTRRAYYRLLLCSLSSDKIEEREIISLERGVRDAEDVESMWDLTVTWIVIKDSWVERAWHEDQEFANFLTFKVTWKHLPLLAQLVGLS